MKKQSQPINVTGAASGFLMIPLMVQRDRRLSDGAKILYGELKRLEFKYEGVISINQTELQRVINKNERQTRKLINQLVDAGWLLKEKVTFIGPNQYTIIAPEEILYKELTAFLSVSKIFKQLKLQDVLTKHNGPRLLRTLEILEYSYRNAKRTVENPLALIRKAMRTGVSADEGFTPGWWKERIEKKARAAKRRKAAADKVTKQKTEQEDMAAWVKSLPKKEYDALRKRAVDALKSNGGLPKYGREQTIKLKMWELEGKK